MKTYRTRAELKYEVKNLLKGNWKKAILLYLIPLIIFVLTNGYNNSNSRATFRYNTSSFDIGTFSKIVTTFGIIGFITSLIFLLINLSANFRAFDWLGDHDLDFDPIKRATVLQ